MPMAFLRCSKCGSDAGFLIETQDRKVMDVKARVALDRIKRSVLVTCTYCNNRWDHVPVILSDRSVEDRLQAHQEARLEFARQ